MARILETNRGGAFLELLLVFPILCLIAFAGIEYARALDQLQIAVNASREIANVAFRDCIVDAVQARRSTQAPHFNQNECLASARSSLLSDQQIAAIFPGLEFSLSVYSFDPATNVVTRDGTANFGTQCIGASQDCASRYSTTVFAERPALGDALREYGTVVIAEVYLPYNALLSGATPMFQFTPRVIYGTTIL